MVARLASWPVTCRTVVPASRCVASRQLRSSDQIVGHRHRREAMAGTAEDLHFDLCETDDRLRPIESLLNQFALARDVVLVRRSIAEHLTIAATCGVTHILRHSETKSFVS